MLKCLKTKVTFVLGHDEVLISVVSALVSVQMNGNMGSNCPMSCCCLQRK